MCIQKINLSLLLMNGDCIFREFKENKTAQETYLDFLRSLLKDKNYIQMCYMTGILPIKKYGTHSALNMFDEISMTQSKPLANYMGFTEEEVSNILSKAQCRLSKNERLV